MPETWPAVLKPHSAGFWMENPSRGGGATTNGQEQVVESLAGRWRARVDIAVRSTEQILAARAFAAALDGRAGTVLVPTFDGKRVNWPVQSFNGASTGLVLTPHVSRRRALDGTAYQDAEVPTASQVVATVNADAALGATSIAINMTQGAAIRAGQYFGIGERLHLIRGIISVVGSVTTVAFRPRLRVAATAGAAVLFTRPLCKMRQVSDEQGLQMLALMRFADLSLEFVEAY